MIRFPKRSIAATAFTLIAGAAAAQSIEGIYQPKGMDWTCLEADIGMFGGALEISNTRVEGVENSCEILSRNMSKSGIVALELMCSGEGETYRNQMRVQWIEGGVRLTRDDHTFEWELCRN